MTRRPRPGAVLGALLSALFTVLVSASAWAHKPSDSYLTLDASQFPIDGRWDIALRDLNDVLRLDADDDGALAWGEVRSRLHDVDTYALNRLILTSGGSACQNRPIDHAVVTHSDGAYLVIRFAVECAGPSEVIDVDYRLLFDWDPHHRGLVSVHRGARAAETVVLAAGDHRRTVALEEVHRGRQLASFVKTGVSHIAAGWDHMLFLLALLLPSVLRRKDGEWIPVDSFRAAFADALRVVTGFNVAHSLTLSLAVLDVVRLPSRFIESAIALSIVVAALNNVRPLVRADRWMASFALGLLHGFGFSATLVDLGLHRAAMAIALAGFNIGVEVGQTSLVMAFLPAAYLMRRSRFYRRTIVVGGSAAIAAVASVCFWQRAMAIDLRLPRVADVRTIEEKVLAVEGRP